MYQSMPPLKALVAFEAAVRHASFKQAAQELFLTPGAVSQQVVKLEQWLGYALFTRQTRQLFVTAKGLNYYASIAPALAQIHAASQRSRRNNQKSVRLSLTQTLAAKWLGPRLGEFMAAYPDIEVHISASNILVDFKSEDVDLAIRHFNGCDPQLSSQLLYDDQVCVYCAPDYFTDADDVARQLTTATLIVTDFYPYWDIWLAQMNIPAVRDKRSLAALHFDQSVLAVEAAKRAQGLVLSNHLIVEDELARGELIEPFATRLNMDKSYYLVQPKKQPLGPSAAILKAWILAQFSQLSYSD